VGSNGKALCNRSQGRYDGELQFDLEKYLTTKIPTLDNIMDFDLDKN